MTVRKHLISLVEEYMNKFEPPGGSWAVSENPDGPSNIERVMNSNMENLTDNDVKHDACKRCDIVFFTFR